MPRRYSLTGPFVTVVRLVAFVAFLLIAGSCAGPPDATPTAPRLVGPTPPQVVFAVAVDGTDAVAVRLGNEGTSALTYALEEVPGWLSIDAASGTIEAGGTRDVTLTASCGEAVEQERRTATLKLRSNDPVRREVDLAVELTCEPPPDASPSAAFTFTPREGSAPLNVAFDAGASHAPEGEIVSYAWDLGDGTTAEGRTVTHTYGAAGEYVVTLRVRDDAGQEATHEETVTVRAADAVPPAAGIEASPASGTTHAPVSVTFTADAEDSDGTVVSYAWTIDGTRAQGETVEHTFEDAGGHEVELVVADDDGATGRASLTYEVLAALTVVPDAVAFDLGDDAPTLDVDAGSAWTLEGVPAWLTAEPSEGSAGTTEVTLQVNEEHLAGGEVTSTITFTEEGSAVDVPITLHLPDVGAIRESTVELTAFVDDEASGTFTVGNEGTAPLSVEAEVSPDEPWLAVGPASTSVAPGEQATFDLTAECGGSADTRQGEISLAFDDPDEPGASVEVTLECQEQVTSGGYEMELRYYGEVSPTDSQKQVFERAADHWGEVIAGDLSEVTVTESTHFCGSSRPAYQGTIDDLVVFIGLFDIDGPGGVLGQAGPCAVRNGSELPAIGFVELDSGDVEYLEDRGLLEDTALHELGHVLGIGTLWVAGSRDLVDPDCPPSGSLESRFTGPAATDAHEQVGGSGSPYVEGDGAEGTRCGHWDEDRYGQELMTGFLNAGEELSRFTIGSLADLGYEVDLSAADDYVVPSAGALRGAERGIELRDVLVTPSTFELE